MMCPRMKLLVMLLAVLLALCLVTAYAVGYGYDLILKTCGLK